MPGDDIIQASKTVDAFYRELRKDIYGKEKHEIIRIMCICLIAREPLLLIGPPGTAKSMLVDNFCRLLGLNRNYDIVSGLKMQLSDADDNQLAGFLAEFNGSGSRSSKLDRHTREMLERFDRLSPKIKTRLEEKLADLHREMSDNGNSMDKTTLGLVLSILDDPENGCGRGYFSYLLTQFTDPSEILGPIDIPKLLGQLVTGHATSSQEFVQMQRELIEKIEAGMVATSRYERITRNMLPRARVAFLDEIFRADSTILNALLTLINERKYYQPDGPRDAPLEVLFGASNTLPAEQELNAFVDRFPLRVYSQSFMEKCPGQQDSLNELLAVASRRVEKKTEEEVAGQYMVQFKRLQEHLDKHIGMIPRTHAVRKRFLELVSRTLSDFQLNISDRRLYKLFRLLCASALLNCHERKKRELVTQEIPLAVDDLRIVKHCWNSTEGYHIAELASVVEAFVKE